MHSVHDTLGGSSLGNRFQGMNDDLAVDPGHIGLLHGLQLTGALRADDHPLAGRHLPGCAAAPCKTLRTVLSPRRLMARRASELRMRPCGVRTTSGWAPRPWRSRISPSSRRISRASGWPPTSSEVRVLSSRRVCGSMTTSSRRATSVWWSATRRRHATPSSTRPAAAAARTRTARRLTKRRRYAPSDGVSREERGGTDWPPPGRDDLVRNAGEMDWGMERHALSRPANGRPNDAERRRRTCHELEQSGSRRRGKV